MTEAALCSKRWSDERRLASFLEKISPEPNSGCWLWAASYGTVGYGQFWNGETLIGAHRFSYEAHKGPIADGLYVLHKCDVRACVNPDHLFLGTQADNGADMVSKGRSCAGPRHGLRKHPERAARGERHGVSKLTEAQIGEIRAAPGLHKDIAAKFGISRQHVGAIKNGVVWGWSVAG